MQHVATARAGGQSPVPPARGGPVRQFTAVGASSLDFASGVAACTGEKSEPTVNPLPYAEPLHQIRRRTRILDYSTPDPPSRPPGGLEPARGPPSWGVVK